MWDSIYNKGDTVLIPHRNTTVPALLLRKKAKPCGAWIVLKLHADGKCVESVSNEFVKNWELISSDAVFAVDADDVGVIAKLERYVEARRGLMKSDVWTYRKLKAVLAALDVFRGCVEGK